MNKKELEVLSILATQYTYELVQYIDVDNIILRDKYGTYKTRLSNLRKQSYPSIISAIDKNEVFINKAKEVHNNNTYDYSQVDYIDNKTKVKIICNLHGEFIQSPASHLKRLWMSFL